MPNSCYTFFQTESADGIDYLFMTEKNRIYTVSFDMSVYASFVDEFQTLLNSGYGMIFSFEPVIPKEKGICYEDQRVCITIVEIIIDFLKNYPDCFIVYQCEDYKEEKFFKKWQNLVNNGEFVKNGIEIEINSNESEYFGFICKGTNPKIKEAVQDVVKFSMALSQKN